MKKIRCPKCGMIMSDNEYVLSDEGFVKLTTFYTCSFCNEEYYDLEELTR
jgi:hypothetical protein